MTHKRSLKFLTVLNSHGHFRFGSNKPVNANVHLLEKSKYYTCIIMFLQKIEV